MKIGAVSGEQNFGKVHVNYTVIYQRKRLD